MNAFLNSLTLLLVLLNPFLIIVYLIDVVQKVDMRQYIKVLIRASLITAAVYICFALLGDAVFSRFMQAEFASFQIFGGVVFILIGVQFVFHGPNAIQMLRGDSEHLAGAIAMPVLIGPGTISACVIIGEKLPPALSCSAILAALVITVLIMIGLKALHDYVRPRKERLIEHYIEIAGRITALFIGTVSVEMIMSGVGAWLEKF